MATNIQRQLPVSVVGEPDARRLLHELQDIESFLRQSRLQSGGQAAAAMPKLSASAQSLAEEAGVSMLDEKHVAALQRVLQGVIDKAPRLHVSFAVEPSPMALQKIVRWFRQNVSPIVLVGVGVQPTIAAGCVVQTASREFDLSLRKNLVQQRALLGQKIRELGVAQS